MSARDTHHVGDNGQEYVGRADVRSELRQMSGEQQDDRQHQYGRQLLQRYQGGSHFHSEPGDAAGSGHGESAAQQEHKPPRHLRRDDPPGDQALGRADRSLRRCDRDCLAISPALGARFKDEASRKASDASHANCKRLPPASLLAS